jgi:hypothetical protein
VNWFGSEVRMLGGRPWFGEAPDVAGLADICAREEQREILSEGRKAPEPTDPRSPPHPQRRLLPVRF